MKDNLIFVKVKNLKQAETLRVVRNDCYKFMTSHSKYISKSDQITWFNNGMSGFQVYLVYLIESPSSNKQLCGYGLIS
jgi:hypothetical protein